MTPGRSDTNRDDSRDEERPAGGDGILGSLRRFLETLDQMSENGESVRHGRAVSDRGTVDYSIRIGSIRDPEHDELSGRPSNAEVSPESPVNVRETDEGVVVHLDLPEVEGETVAAGVDGRTLVVGVDNNVYKRIRLPRYGLTVIAGAYRNGILELHLEDGGDGDDGDDTAETQTHE
ncbi:GvpH protein [Halogranum rubrum]|uniref:GvpH protein n=1 Tax=Halogranum rubrum TaxID=553466 RepID=A0A1I4EQW7_9EURY|nr:gas vesicle protein GvpH [Halogranum rubrum]SFL07490.1 GvpH protein [Halogranum rubrum]